MTDAGDVIGTAKGEMFFRCVCEHCGVIFSGTGSAPQTDADNHCYDLGHAVAVNVHYKLAQVRERARPVLRLVE